MNAITAKMAGERYAEWQHKAREADEVMRALAPLWGSGNTQAKEAYMTATRTRDYAYERAHEWYEVLAAG